MRRDWALILVILVLLAGCGAAGYVSNADLADNKTAWDPDLETEKTGAVPLPQEWDVAAGAERLIAYPYWDKKESMQEYAKRAGLPPEVAFDLGGGVRLEMVLIPAGKAELGTPEPERPPAVWRGSLAFLCGVVAFALTILGSVLHARRNHTRVQFSLRWLLLMASAASMGVIGALHWRELSQRHEVYAKQLRLWRGAKARTEEFETPFYLAKYETTNSQVDRLAQRMLGFFGLPASDPHLPNYPRAWVRLEDAVAYCRELFALLGVSNSSLDRHRFRLPTEKEWEYACRAGRSTIYHSGDRIEDLDAVAWWSGNSGGHAHPVAQKAPNAFGLYDMHGNVTEWCGPPPATPPARYYDQNIRGGSFQDDIIALAAATRLEVEADISFPVLGFRCMLCAPRTEEQRAAFLEWLDVLAKKKDAAP